MTTRLFYTHSDRWYDHWSSDGAISKHRNVLDSDWIHDTMRESESITIPNAAKNVNIKNYFYTYCWKAATFSLILIV